MPRDKFHHVVKKADARGHLCASAALDGESDEDIGFVGFAVDLRLPHTCTSTLSFSSLATSRSAASNQSVCVAVPRVIRTQPSHPGSLDLSRTNIPRCLIAATKSQCRSPILISTKFASL